MRSHWRSCKGKKKKNDALFYESNRYDVSTRRPQVQSHYENCDTEDTENETLMVFREKTSKLSKGMFFAKYRQRKKSRLNQTNESEHKYSDKEVSTLHQSAYEDKIVKTGRYQNWMGSRSERFQKLKQTDPIRGSMTQHKYSLKHSFKESSGNNL
mmetsp:Transcript_9740/g.12655  ORF Transcript_9740/g.12655 Transcript_9740/m.12655 type:complete len:155 (-) Transcript_9740:200-664(-)